MLVAVMLYLYFFQSDIYLFDTFKYQGSNTIYADDSKSEIGVGFAAVNRRKTTVSNLSSAASIFTAVTCHLCSSENDKRS